jgi:peroxiredoxin
MSRRFFVLIELLTAGLLALSTLELSAAETVKLDSLKVGSITYRDVTILGESVTDLYFRYDGGIANVKLKYLSSALQKQFGYDPKAAAAAEKREMEQQSAYMKTLADQIAAQAQKRRQAAEEEAASQHETLADPISKQSLLNRPAPKLTSVKWLGETPPMEGKAVLIFFWTTWSLPCQNAILDMNTYAKDFHDQLTVIGISPQKEKEVADFEDVKTDFPLGVDPDGKLEKELGLTSVPQVLFIDAQGTVRYVGHPGALNRTLLKQFLLKPTAE